MKSRALLAGVVAALVPGAPDAAPPEYLVTAAPLAIGAPTGLFHGDAASIARTPGGATEIRFRARRSEPLGVMDVLVLLDGEMMRSAATGSTASIVRRNNLELPGFSGLAIPARGADRIPANVMSTLTARFPQAKIDKWTREKEDGKDVYDIEFKQGDRKFEADIFADGTIHNWEQQIAPGDLPPPVRQTLARQFPKASLKAVMAITEVKSGREELQGYEIVVKRVFRDVEVTIAPDGRVLEGPGKQK